MLDCLRIIEEVPEGWIVDCYVANFHRTIIELDIRNLEPVFLNLQFAPNNTKYSTTQ